MLVGDRPQLVVPAGAWQSARSLGGLDLVGCTVSPAFRFEGFELAPDGWKPGIGVTVATAAGPDLEVAARAPERYELVRTLAPLRHGHGDPTIRLEDRPCAAAATRTPDGPASIEVVDAGRELIVRAWGPGASWCNRRAPELSA